MPPSRLIRNAQRDGQGVGRLIDSGGLTGFHVLSHLLVHEASKDDELLSKDRGDPQRFPREPVSTIYEVVDASREASGR